VIKKVTGSGRIKPAMEVNISANVSGKILNIYAKEGQRVKKGQLLVRLDSEQYAAALKRAESALLGALANEKKAQSDYNRNKLLFDQHLISPADLEASEAALMAARATREQNEASRDEARDQLNKTKLYASMDGVITKLNKEVGEMAIGATFQEDVIMVVSDLSVMESLIEVDENEVVNIQIGDSADVELDAFPDTLFRGYVTEIANSAITKGLGTQEEITNFEVTVTIDNAAARFRPGMSTTVDVYTQRVDDVVRVPIQAVTVREAGRLKKKVGVEERAPSSANRAKNKMVEVVFVEEDGMARAKPVKLGISDDDYYQVISGLNEGERVITGPFKILSKLLKDGDKVSEKKEKENAD
ncbi:MAG TPA: efflux RND transporter periplasmic adaptor subunit, partial [Caldithrix abyssi]|nr:efflux RND transporter periplasmic adaptor subunit [Caldithrix abyssi]